MVCIFSCYFLKIYLYTQKYILQKEKACIYFNTCYLFCSNNYYRFIYTFIKKKKENICNLKRNTPNIWSGTFYTLPIEKEYAAFFSHRKKGNQNISEIIALLFKNITHVSGWNTLFDRDSLLDISDYVGKT